MTSALHDKLVLGRRAERLATLVAEDLPRCRRVLDVGCGDGRISLGVLRRRPGIDLTGVDVLVRPTTAVPVVPYDGSQLPFEDGAFDVVTMIDVLHHAEDPQLVLSEASRVASDAVVVKDHLLEGAFALTTLRLMDHVGNARHGVALPYTYWTPDRWNQAFSTLGLRVDLWRGSLGLYPPPVSWLFDRSLHFLAVLRRS